MDIRIKNFHIPEGCSSCPAFHFGSFHDYCYILDLPINVETEDNERLPECPLEEIKEEKPKVKNGPFWMRDPKDGHIYKVFPENEGA